MTFCNHSRGRRDPHDVDAPRLSNVKLTYDPALGLFTISRALPLGTNNPFDWCLAHRS
jgi:hypothetical protein